MLCHVGTKGKCIPGIVSSQETSEVLWPSKVIFRWLNFSSIGVFVYSVYKQYLIITLFKFQSGIPSWERLLLWHQQWGDPSVWRCREKKGTQDLQRSALINGHSSQLHQRRWVPHRNNLKFFNIVFSFGLQTSIIWLEHKWSTLSQGGCGMQCSEWKYNIFKGSLKVHISNELGPVIYRYSA